MKKTVVTKGLWGTKRTQNIFKTTFMEHILFFTEKIIFVYWYPVYMFFYVIKTTWSKWKQSKTIKYFSKLLLLSRDLEKAIFEMVSTHSKWVSCSNNLCRVFQKLKFLGFCTNNLNFPLLDKSTIIRYVWVMLPLFPPFKIP